MYHAHTHILNICIYKLHIQPLHIETLCFMISASYTDIDTDLRELWWSIYLKKGFLLINANDWNFKVNPSDWPPNYDHHLFWTRFKGQPALLCCPNFNSPPFTSFKLSICLSLISCLLLPCFHSRVTFFFYFFSSLLHLHSFFPFLLTSFSSLLFLIFLFHPIFL